MGVGHCRGMCASFPHNYGADIMLTRNLRCWKNQVILQFHFLWISPYTNYDACNKAICHPYWAIHQTGIEYLCWNSVMNYGVFPLVTGLKWEEEDCGCYLIIRLFTRYTGGFDEQLGLVLGGVCRGDGTEQGIEDAERGSKCVAKELDRLGLTLASFLPSSIYWLCNFGQVS